jgi:hypothetical protein
MAAISISVAKDSRAQQAVRGTVAALPQSARLEDVRAFQKLAKACGCAEGAIGALILLAFVLTHFICASVDWSLFDLTFLFIQIIAAFLIGGFAGKYVGLAIARARLRRLCDRIHREARMHMA